MLPLLFLLPLASAQIRINLSVGGRGEEPRVEFSGSSVEVISDQEAVTFGLSDNQLKNAIERYVGGRPTDVFLKSPTPWNDLYLRFNWRQVHRTLVPLAGRIVGIRSQPVVVSSHDFVNNSTVTAKYKASIAQEVQDTVSSTWSTGGSLTVTHGITYGVNLALASVGGSTSISISGSWGKDQTTTQTISVGSSSGVEVELAPGQAVTVSVEASRGSMEVQMDYRATVDGQVAANYPRRFQNSHFWAYSLSDMQDRVNLGRKTVDSRETIRIGFYSNARVIVRDKMSRSVLATADAILANGKLLVNKKS